MIQGNIPLNKVSVTHYQDNCNSLFTGLFASNFSLFKSFSHIAVNHRFDHAIPSLRIIWSHLTAYRMKTKHPQTSLNADTIWPQLSFNCLQPYPIARLACALFRSFWHSMKNPGILPNSQAREWLLFQACFWVFYHWPSLATTKEWCSFTQELVGHFKDFEYNSNKTPETFSLYLHHKARS